MRTLLRNLVLALIGYGAAVLVASFFCLLVIFGPEIASSAIVKRQNVLGDFFTAYAVGTALTVTTAWPGFVATLAVSRWRGYRSGAYFSICGMATGVLAVFLLAFWDGSIGTIGDFLIRTPAVYLGGLAGGFAYALFDRRFRVFA